MRNGPQGGVQMIFPEYFPVRSQDLPIALHDAAQFYWGTAAAWLELAPIFSERSVPADPEVAVPGHRYPRGLGAGRIPVQTFDHETVKALISC